VYGYNIPALKVNIIIVHPRGVVFPRGKETNKRKTNITENENLSSVSPPDSSKKGSKTTHIGLDTLALKKLKNKEKRENNIPRVNNYDVHLKCRH
jgi:hypothetical protein